jgi:hypothetical protein
VGGCRAKVLELAELQRRLDASEEERQRSQAELQAELQAEQARLSFAKAEREAASSELTSYRTEMQERLDMLVSSQKETEQKLRAALLCEAEQVDHIPCLENGSGPFLDNLPTPFGRKSVFSQLRARLCSD